MEQHKNHFTRFMQSVLTKVGKVRGLIKDLTENYDEKEPGSQYLWRSWPPTISPLWLLRSVKELQQHVKNLEGQYDILNDEMARGENCGYSET